MAGSTVDAEAFNAFEAAGWETTAGGYDDFFGQITPRAVEPLLDAAQVVRGVGMLDVACGPGHAAGRAAERGALVVCSTARSGRRRSFVLRTTTCRGACARRSTACWTITGRVLVLSYRYP